MILILLTIFIDELSLSMSFIHNHIEQYIRDMLESD